MDYKEQERMVKELEVAIERLQALYNQYFMGIEKLEPLIPKKTVERKLNELRKIKFYNTALRFRFQTQVQKYSTHMTHWRRICRQIEEGTYKRDIMRAKARSGQADAVTDKVRDGAESEVGAFDETGMPVFDLEAMFNEVEDAFEQGFDLDAQLDAIASISPPPAPATTVPMASRPRDVVEPVGSASASSAPSRTSGVPIPVSSLKASRKTDEARSNFEPSSPQAPSRFRPAPSAVASTSSGAKPPPPPTMSQKTAAPPPPPGTSVRKPPPPVRAGASASSGNSIDEQKIQSVYRAYVAARKQTNESTDNINLQKISSLLKKTEKEKGGVSDFKVVIRNGKAVIKAVK